MVLKLIETGLIDDKAKNNNGDSCEQIIKLIKEKKRDNDIKRWEEELMRLE
jgi:hypothetical protein